MKKKFLYTLLLIVLAALSGPAIHAQEDATVRGSAMVRFEQPGEKPLGHAGQVQGDVFLLRSGDALWQPALTGMALLKGDQLRTGARSGALVELRDGTSIKLGPVSLLAFDETGQAQQSEASAAASLSQGKLWASVSEGGGLDRLIIKAGGAVFDSAHGNIFVELDSRGAACADVFTGLLNARSVSAPADIVQVDASQRVTLEDDALESPHAFSAAYNQTDDSYTCLAVSAQPPETAEVSEAGLVFSVVDAGASEEIVVITGSVTVTFTSGEAATDTHTYTTPDGALAFTAEDAVPETAASVDAPVYEDVVILSSAMVTFQAEEEACTTAPVLSSVTAGEQDAAAGGSVALTVDTCSAVTVDLAGAVSAACGDVSSVSVTAGGETLSVDAGDTSWSASFTPDSDAAASVQIRAKDSAGNESEAWTFQVSIVREVPEPTIEIVTVAHLAASDITGVADVYRNNLESNRLIITGAAASENCAIKTVEVSVDGGSTWVAAEGTANWTYSFSPVDGTYNITARVTDELDNLSAEMFQPLEVAYHSKTEEDNLREVFMAMLQAYIDKDASTFMDYTSASYSSNYDSIEDKSNLDNSLEGKFAAFATIYLRYKIDQLIISGDEGRVSFFWDATPATTGYAQYGTFLFTKEPEWMFVNVEDDNTFLRYTSVAERVTVQADKTTLVADESDSTTITVNVSDSAGNHVADGTEVTFTATDGDITPSATTMSGNAVATYTAGSAPGQVSVTATVGSAAASVTLTLQPERAPLPPD